MISTTMSNIQNGQLDILAERLSKIDSQINELENQKNSYRAQALALLLQTKNTNYVALGGKFTVCSGKTTREITCLKYIKAKEKLEDLKIKAIAAGYFKEKTGQKSLRFDPYPC